MAAERLLEEQDHIFSDGEFQVQICTKKIRKILAPGSFENLQAKNAVKIVYDGWESSYRKRLGDLVGESIQGDIWGDLRHIRRSITHRNSKGVEELNHAKLITGLIPE